MRIIHRIIHALFPSRHQWELIYQSKYACKRWERCEACGKVRWIFVIPSTGGHEMN